jgi:hypothetical protein
MGITRKAAVLFLTLIIAMSGLTLFTVKATSAWPISAPNFTVKVIDGAYTTPVSYSTDPYTGQTITNPGTTYQTRNITFTIQNAPQVNYYLVEYKGHYATDPRWTPIYTWGLNVTAKAAPGAQTVITISSSSPEQTSVADPLYWGNWAYTFTSGSKLDFRLEAISGVETGDPLYGWSANHPRISGDTSPWSVQTIQIGEPSNLTSAPTPAVPEFSWLAILPLLLSAVCIALILKRRKLTHG